MRKGEVSLNAVRKIFCIVRILIVCVIILTISPSSSFSSIFDVTNEEELRQALSDSASNSEDDTSNISAGEYFTNGEAFTYESEEDFSLTIAGEGMGLTIISGGGQSRVLEIANQTTNGSEATLIIRNLTISGGSESEPPYMVAGFKAGGFKDITMEKCTIGDNFSELGDGGFSISGQNVTFSNNSVSGNLTRGGFIGGGSISGSQVMLVNNRFGGNTAEKGPGGASISGEIVTLTGNEFTVNVSRDDVGGVRISGDSINLTNNKFSGNHGVLLGLGGAVVGVGNGGQASLINNIFENNTSAGPGGGLDIFVSAQAEPIDETTILTLTNNTLSLNKSEGVSVSAGSANGGGIYIAGDDNTIMNIYNNIIFDNFAADGGDDIFVDDYRVGTNIGSTVNLFNNDFSDFISVCENTEGCEPNIKEGDNIDFDPLFVDAEAGDVSLQPDSPCIDAGDPNAPEVPSTDFFGNPRVPPPDMGAVEFVEEAQGGGGCSIAPTPVASSLAVFLGIPVVILIRRIVKRYRSY